MFKILDEDSEKADSENAVELTDAHGEVRLDNVVFGYTKDKTILKGISVDVKAGTKIAVVGPTGAGKTTVINMLTRFYDVQQGSVTIDGKDVREVTLDSLRKEVGVLMQDPFIFKGTVMENIRYGRPDATDEEIMAALKTVSADKIIDRLEGGLDSEAGEGGGNLSTGEKQLISFARAILSDPKILILDEATSSVDTETERLIQDAV